MEGEREMEGGGRGLAADQQTVTLLTNVDH